MLLRRFMCQLSKREKEGGGEEEREGERARSGEREGVRGKGRRVNEAEKEIRKSKMKLITKLYKMVWKMWKRVEFLLME